MCTLHFKNPKNDKKYKGDFVVLKGNCMPLLDSRANLVVTQKANGNVRVCIDPQPLNAALKRSHYTFPVIENVLLDLSDAKVFSKADLKDGFLQLELDEKSSKLTTFQSPWGRYRWLRLAFGV